MLSFKSFIIESNEKEGGHLHAFDIDGTLFNPDVKIRVMHGAQHAESLSHSEFNNHVLKPGHHYDFSEFKSSKKFERSKPIPKMLNKLQAIQRNIKSKPRNRIILNTARADFDDKPRFLNALKNHGIDTEKVRVERAGNDASEMTTGQKKAQIISGHIENGKYKHVSLYDDDAENLRQFLKLREKHTGITFHAHHVQTDGSTRKFEE